MLSYKLSFNIIFSTTGFSGDNQQKIQCILINRCCFPVYVCCTLFFVGNMKLLPPPPPPPPLPLLLLPMLKGFSTSALAHVERRFATLYLHYINYPHGSVMLCTINIFFMVPFLMWFCDYSSTREVILAWKIWMKPSNSKNSKEIQKVYIFCEYTASENTQKYAHYL